MRTLVNAYSGKCVAKADRLITKADTTESTNADNQSEADVAEPQMMLITKVKLT